MHVNLNSRLLKKLFLKALPFTRFVNISFTQMCTLCNNDYTHLELHVQNKRCGLVNEKGYGTIRHYGCLGSITQEMGHDNKDEVSDRQT